MTQVHDMERRALEYIRNAGGSPEVSWFDEDHEPIGPKLRSDLMRKGLIAQTSADDLGAHRVTLTDAGTQAIST